MTRFKLEIGMLLAGSILVASALEGCGAGVREKAETTVEVAYTATSALSSSFVAWDKAHQEALVESSSTQEEAEGKLDAYRSGPRKKVEAAFVVAFDALGIAALAVADTGQADFTHLVSDALLAAVRVKEALDALRSMKSPPPGPLPRAQDPDTSEPEGATP